MDRIGGESKPPSSLDRRSDHNSSAVHDVLMVHRSSGDGIGNLLSRKSHQGGLATYLIRECIGIGAGWDLRVRLVTGAATTGNMR